jgi:hypothetical protein
MITKKIPGVVNQGRFCPYSQTDYAVVLAGLSGKRVNLIIEREIRRRSNNQNKYYWKVPIEILRNHCGMTPEEIHDAVRYELLYDTVIVGKKEMRKLKSTACLSTVDMENYLMALRMWAATELGVNIPEPNEVGYEAA